MVFYLEYTRPADTTPPDETASTHQNGDARRRYSSSVQTFLTRDHRHLLVLRDSRRSVSTIDQHPRRGPALGPLSQDRDSAYLRGIRRLGACVIACWIHMVPVICHPSIHSYGSRREYNKRISYGYYFSNSKVQNGFGFGLSVGNFVDFSYVYLCYVLWSEDEP